MATQSAPRRYTYREFAALPYDGKRHELVFGELYATPSPTGAHQTIVTNGLILFRGALRQPEEGLVLPGIDVVFPDDRAVRPDIIVLSASRRDRYRRTCIARAPDLVVEILSPGGERHDRVRKWAWYEEFGVLEYWIVSQDQMQVEVCRREGPRFEEPVVQCAGDRLDTPILPRLSATVADLYAGLPEAIV